MMAKIGRPTKYKAEYCDLLVEHMKTGKSFRSFAAKIGTHWDALYDWDKKYSEFSDAKKRGEAVCLDFWEELGLTHIHDKSALNSAVYIFNMKNRFGWRDVVDVEQASTHTLNIVTSKGTEKYPL